jgi:hypothetical protein
VLTPPSSTSVRDPPGPLPSGRSRPRARPRTADSAVRLVPYSSGGGGDCHAIVGDVVVDFHPATRGPQSVCATPITTSGAVTTAACSLAASAATSPSPFPASVFTFQHLSSATDGPNDRAPWLAARSPNTTIATTTSSSALAHGSTTPPLPSPTSVSPGELWYGNAGGYYSAGASGGGASVSVSVPGSSPVDVHPLLHGLTVSPALTIAHEHNEDNAGSSGSSSTRQPAAAESNPVISSTSNGGNSNSTSSSNSSPRRRGPVVVPRSLTPLYITDSPLLSASPQVARTSRTPTPTLTRSASAKRPHSAGTVRRGVTTPNNLSRAHRHASATDVSYLMDSPDVQHSVHDIDKHVIGEFAVTSPVILTSVRHMKVRATF